MNTDGLVAGDSARAPSVIPTTASRVCVGMDPESVKRSWGLPVTIAKRSGPGGRYEEWRYPSQVISFRDDRVAAVR